MKQRLFQSGTCQARPGEHYTVKEPSGNEYHTFPDIKPLEIFRHCWIIERRPRPVVPIIEGLPLPSLGKGKDYIGRYLSSFFRPWTLLGDTERTALDDLFRECDQQQVPHLSLLGVVAGSDADTVDYEKAFRNYITHGVVSHHAAQLIQTFLLNTLCGIEDTTDDVGEADKSDLDEEIPALQMRTDEFRSLLARHESCKRVNDRQKAQRVQHWWANKSAATQLASARLQEGPVHTNAVKHIEAKKVQNDNDPAHHPYSGKTLPKAQLYPATAAEDLDVWLKKLSSRQDIKPTQQQQAFLSALCERIKTEASEETNPAIRKSTKEPMFDMIHGVPGCGKSQLIAWIRELFENVLRWEHGIQFVCLAIQNAMAAHIDGYTVHHWTGIPVGEKSMTTRNLHNFANKCMSVRFVLIDEISMVSAYMFGTIEQLMRKVPSRVEDYDSKWSYSQGA